MLRQTDYYAEQSTAVTKLITTLGFLIAFLMAIGAVFGALNTMYSSVSARTREIATLRALGFGSGAVVVSVMLESIALALLGGAVGAGLSYFAFNGFHTATMNWQSFSQITFSLAVTPQLLLVQGVVLATADRRHRGPVPRDPRRPPADRRGAAGALTAEAAGEALTGDSQQAYEPARQAWNRGFGAGSIPPSGALGSGAASWHWTPASQPPISPAVRREGADPTRRRSYIDCAA